MAAWDDRFNGAVLWHYLDAVKAAVAEGPALDDESERLDLARVQLLIALAEQHRETDPQLITQTMLDMPANPLNAMATVLNTWRNGSGYQHLRDAASRCVDEALDAFRVWPQLDKNRTTKAVVQASKSYKSEVQTAILGLEESLAAAREQATAARASAEDTEASAQAALGQLATQITTLEERMQSERKQVLAVHDNVEESFLAAEKTREQRFASTIAEADERLTEALARSRENGEAQVESLRQLHEQARELVGAISIAGTATGYENYARQERRSAIRWAVLAVALSLGGFGFIVLTVANHSSDTWHATIIRLAATLTLGGVATYCGRQSAQHREQERKAKRMQLDIAALNPFIENLDPEVQAKVRETFADRMFGSPTTSEAPAINGLPANTVELLTQLLGVVTKAADLAKK